MKQAISAFVLALGATVTIGAAGGSSATAPELRLPASDGGTVNLADFRGRVVLVDFWASWCAPCKASFPLLDALRRDLQPKGVEVLAVNVDERRRDMDAFLADRSHSMPILIDPKGVAAQAFGVQAMPSSFVIDRSGKIRFAHAGYTATTVQRYREEIAMLLAER